MGSGPFAAEPPRARPGHPLIGEKRSGGFPKKAPWLDFFASRGSHRSGHDAGRYDLRCACDGAREKSRGSLFARWALPTPRPPSASASG